MQRRWRILRSPEPHQAPATIFSASSSPITVFASQIRPLRTRFDVQAAWIETELQREGLDFGPRFDDFQLIATMPRIPYWEGNTRYGRRTVITARVTDSYEIPRLKKQIEQLSKQLQQTSSTNNRLAHELDEVLAVGAVVGREPVAHRPGIGPGQAHDGLHGRRALAVLAA